MPARRTATARLRARGAGAPPGTRRRPPVAWLASRPEEVPMLRALFRNLVLVALLSVPYGSDAAHAQQDACSDFPLSITDDAGITTTFASPPQRLISLNPGLTEITFALGHGQSLIAVDSYSDYPAEAKQIQPRLNTYPSPSVE